MAPPKKKPWWPAPIIAEHFLSLVARLRFYLAGENYTSGRYADIHVKLFAAEMHLRAMDLDGEGLLGDEISLPASDVMDQLTRTMDRLSDMVVAMDDAVREAGAGGSTGGCAAAAQEAVALWLGADGHRMLARLYFLVDHVASVCYHGRLVLEYDAASRCRMAAVPQEESVVECAKCRRARKGRGRLHIRRSLHR